MSTLFRKYDEKDLKKLQKDILVVFEKFDSLCTKYDINYFAMAGTLLGAVRHEGFIPWDDDMDIGMLYSDYLKFINIPKEEFEEYGLYSPHVNPGGYFSFVTKFYYKDSRFVSPVAKASGKDDMGIFIELFPFFDVPADNKKIKMMKLKVDLLKNLYSVTSVDRISVFDEGLKKYPKLLFKYMVKSLCSIFNITSDRLAGWYDRTVTKYNGVDSGVVLSSSDTFKVYKKSWVDRCIRVKYEDTEMLIPKGYKNYLKYFYGDDYMQLPPESKRWNQAAKYIRFMDGSVMTDE